MTTHDHVYVCTIYGPYVWVPDGGEESPVRYGDKAQVIGRARTRSQALSIINAYRKHFE